MTLVSSHDWHDHIDLIEGEPDSKELNALCLLCYASHPIGKYIYENYPIELEDGTTTSFEDWRAEYERNSVSRAGSRRRRLHCPRCDFATPHVAES